MTSTISRAQHADASALRVLKLAAKPKPSGAERDRLQKLSGDATSQIKDDAVREAFLRLAGYFRQRERLAEIGQGQAAPVQDLLFIGRFGMVRSAEFAASQLQNELRGAAARTNHWQCTERAVRRSICETRGRNWEQNRPKHRSRRKTWRQFSRNGLAR